MAVQHKSLGRQDATKDQFAVVWELFGGKAAAAGGRVMCISSLPLDSRTLDPSSDLPAIEPPYRPAFLQPRSTDQLHSLFTLVSYYQRAAPLLANQHYFSRFTSPEAPAAAIMPGPLRERDPNAHAYASRRSSIQFLDSLRPKSYLSHQRLAEHDLSSADESEENTDPHFMISTKSQSARVASSKSPLDKPLPIRPVAHVVSTSPYKEGRTLIDASEKPLSRSLGTSSGDYWPTLSPTQRATPGTHSDPMPPQSSRIPIDSRTPASPGKQRPTIKMVAQTSNENILPSSGRTEKISTPLPPGASNPGAKLPLNPSTSPPKSFNPKRNPADHTAGSSLPQPRPKLVDIPSPKSRPGRRPPVTNAGAIPRPRGNPRPSGPTQANNTRQTFHQPYSDHPGGYSRMDTPNSGSPELRPVSGGMGLPRSPVNHQENVKHKKSAIPVPSRTTSPHSMPSGPAVFTLKAKVSTPSSLGGKSLSTIESADTGRIEQDMDTSTVMRRGPQRRPTLSGTVREYKHLSADTDADPTTLSAHTETTVSRPSSRTESLIWVETEKNEGIHADELIMGRKTTPSPPVPPVSSASARSSGQRSRDLHRRAVTNEHRKASGQSDASSGMRAKSRTAAPAKTLRHRSSTDSIQAENFTVRSATEQKHYSSDFFPQLDNESVHLPTPGRADENIPDDNERLAAVSQTLAMLEGGHRKGAENPQFKQDAALAMAYVDKAHKSPTSAHYSDVFRSSQAHHSSGGLVRSDSGHSTVSSKRVTSLSRGAANMKRSSSVNSIASSRPAVPAKDYRPTSKAPSKASSIQRRESSGRGGTAGLRSPYGLVNGYSATPSNIPQPSNGRGSSARLGSGQAMTDTSQSISGEKRSVSKAKLTMSGFRGFFQKRGDLRISGKAGDKKKRSNTKESELTQTTALAMRVTTMAREQEDDSKKHQLLSVATAMLGAIDSAKHAKIAAEQAAQAAREASMHQEMTRQSLIAINKILTNSHGLMNTLSCSRNSLRQRSSRPSTIVQ
ncbi:hypothetical protein SLS58_002497 [Diplodia intermedia]|uniref:Uncharacterized protein n=1 Tax=Diplodia intermedia TaxID=856260 RepID=A0ABR3TYN0_9PEZI